MCNSYLILAQMFLIDGDFQKMAVQSVLSSIFLFFSPKIVCPLESHNLSVLLVGS